MSPPTAIITGGSSGMGLALVEYLLEREWQVVMADINPPKEKLDNTLFINCDVSSWHQQASMFRQAYDWTGRLDFAALNAGIDDRDDIFASISGDPAKPPREPNMKTLDVNLVGPYYGIKLAAHYMSLDSKTAGKPKPGGKINVVSSGAGIYPLPPVPMYCASKHAIVGLVRAVAPAARAVNIAVNTVCPSLVSTPILPDTIREAYKEADFTPFSTIMQCHSEVACLDQVGNEDWVQKGKFGDTVEGGLEGLVWHQAPQRPSTSFVSNEEGLSSWAKVFPERSKKFAAMDWKNGT